MPTDTFFRLPEEKRERILDAAWEEFTGTGYAGASINRIIREAGIPRGSFYQYFADKDDLFLYLAGSIREYALDGYLAVLRDCGGDFFRAAMAAFDGVRALQGMPGIRMIDRSLAFLRANSRMDFRGLCGEGRGWDWDWLEPVWEATDFSFLRSDAEEYARSSFFLCLTALGTAVVDSLQSPEHWDRSRAWLSEAIRIMQFGCLAPAAAAERPTGGTV